MTMTPDDIAVIKARTDAATPGPWWYDPRSGEVLGPDGQPVCDLLPMSEDIAFVCEARTDVPALIAEVERLREFIQRRPTLARAWHAEEEAEAAFGDAVRLGTWVEELEADCDRLARRIAAVEALCDEYDSIEWRIPLDAVRAALGAES
jgi:hypothetical protein